MNNWKFRIQCLAIIVLSHILCIEHLQIRWCFPSSQVCCIIWYHFPLIFIFLIAILSSSRAYDSLLLVQISMCLVDLFLALIYILCGQRQWLLPTTRWCNSTHDSRHHWLYWQASIFQKVSEYIDVISTDLFFSEKTLDVFCLRTIEYRLYSNNCHVIYYCRTWEDHSKSN